MTSDLTVVVATRDRPASLRILLEALQREHAVTAFETIVVDDGSLGVREIVERLPDTRLLRSRGRGVGAARNAGASQARTEFIGLLDDDCEPVPGWVEHMLARLRAADAVVTGPVLPGTADRLQIASQLLANALVDPRAAELQSTRFALGTNLACRTEVLRSIPFDERYGGIGAEDRDWCARLAQAGVQIAYEPGAAVRHRQELDLREFLGRQYRYGRGAYVYHAIHERGRIERPAFYARLVGRALRVGLGVGVLVCAAQVAAALGFAREALTRRERSGRPLPFSRRRGSRAGRRAA